MKQQRERSQWTMAEKLLIVLVWVTAIVLLVAVIIKIRVLF